jgi:hypothetical protein
MTGKSHLTIAAFVAEHERGAIESATRHIAQALSQAAEAPWTCDCVFGAELETLPTGGEGAIIVTSFLPQLDKVNEPWADAEKRLRAAYAKLAESGAPVFICTVLRHVGGEVEPELARALLVRIRQLDLLAAEISRETGTYVIDLDRLLADVGARRLQTDYRLAGNAVAEAAGHFIALTLVGNALDAFVSFEVQDAARVSLTSSQPAIAQLNGAKPEITLRKDLMSMGHGRRKQIVSPVLYTVQENYIGWLTRQVLQGRIGPKEAFQRLIQAIRRRGVRESAALLASGLSKQINRKK